jgi:hypothetical protein
MSARLIDVAPGPVGGVAATGLAAIGDGWIVVRHPDLDSAIAIGDAFASELRIVTG